MPGSTERMLAKAPTVGADELVIDLEDAVVASAKDEARHLAFAALSSEAWQGRVSAVRVNAVRSPWCHLDLLTIAEVDTRPLSIVLPKVESAADLGFAERLLDGAEAPGREPRIGLQALIETARGLANVAEIAAASGRLEAVILGYADLAASLGRTTAASADPDLWLGAQDALLVAARANDLQAIDGPYLGVDTGPAFEVSASRARDLGFDGKWAIHPTQIDGLNRSFTPSAAEIAHARGVLVALEQAEREGGRGAVDLDGQMLDEALAASARRLLTRAGEGISR